MGRDNGRDNKAVVPFENFAESQLTNSFNHILPFQADPPKKANFPCRRDVYLFRGRFSPCG